MAQGYSVGGNVDTKIIGAAIRQYRFVKISTAADNTILECDAEEVDCGVSLEAGTAAADIIKYQKDGIAKVQLGGTVTRGAWVNSDADGKAVTESTTNTWASGKALRSGVSGDIVEVDLDKAGYISTS